MVFERVDVTAFSPVDRRILVPVPPPPVFLVREWGVCGFVERIKRQLLFRCQKSLNDLDVESQGGLQLLLCGICWGVENYMQMTEVQEVGLVSSVERQLW